MNNNKGNSQRSKARQARGTKLSSVHFSTGNVEWSTPDDLFRELDGVFGFTLDACADSSNAKRRHYYTREQNALLQTWSGTVFMNPPYGREIPSFMKKAYESSRAGATVVCLVPSRTDNRWWHGYVMRGQIIFLRGRLKFSDGKTPAPFASATVVFWGRGLANPKRWAALHDRLRAGGWA